MDDPATALSKSGAEIFRPIAALIYLYNINIKELELNIRIIQLFENIMLFT